VAILGERGAEKPLAGESRAEATSFRAAPSDRAREPVLIAGTKISPCKLFEGSRSD
jgi:hypothetical protein